MILEHLPAAVIDLVPSTYHSMLDVLIQLFLLAVTTVVLGFIGFAFCKFVYQLIGLENHPDVNRTVTQLIEARGFGCETHKVKTKDGYYLTLIRIVNPLIKKNDLQLKPILCVHGMGGCASSWLLAGDDGLEPEEINANVDHDRPVGDNTACVLANRGYDVWLGNYRGTIMSCDHEQYTQDDPEYWDYTMDDISEFDIPAMVDYVLKKTGSETLGYIGISQGNTVMFGLLAERPEYNQKIKPFISMAPVVVTSNSLSAIPFKWLIIPVLQKILLFRPGPMIPKFLLWFNVYVQTSNPFAPIINFIFGRPMLVLMGGRDFKTDRVEIFHSKDGGLCGKKSFVHSLQLHLSGVFEKFDHGKAENMRRYRQETPPAYNLSNITNRTMVFMSCRNDTIVDFEDVQNLKQSLNHVKLMDDYVIPNDKWNHVDYHFGNNLGLLVNKKLLEFFRKAETIK